MILGRCLKALSVETATKKLEICGRLGIQKSAVVYIQRSHYSGMGGKEWREKPRVPSKPKMRRGMPVNLNAYGPLTDRPDYHFVKDGRKAPPGSGKIKRVKEQREWMERIISLTAQVDFAVERYERKVKEGEDAKARILSSKLKQKGKVPSEY